ncbi:MAG: hypothetical protein RL701_2233 [Pseudomonadota bacterium]
MRQLATMCWLNLSVAQALAACGGIDTIGTLVPVAVVTGGTASMPAHDAGSDSSTMLADPYVDDAGAEPVRDAGSVRPDAGNQPSPVVPSTDPLCIGALADRALCESARSVAFGRAICSCGDVLGGGTVSTETVTAQGFQADVGVNGKLSLRIGRRNLADSDGAIAGALQIAGSGLSPITGAGAEIRGDLTTAGSVAFAGSIHVLGTVYSREIPVGNGSLLIDGDLHHTSQLGASALTPPNVVVVGSLLPDNYVAGRPCACAASDTPRLRGMIDAAVSSNDNTGAKLTAESLAALTLPRTLNLSCGRYYFTNISSASSLELNITGSVTIFVAGDFVLRGDMKTTLAPGAELDLVVGGDLNLSGAARFGDSARPRASRIYVQGKVDLAKVGDQAALSMPTGATGDAVIVGNFYAPTAAVWIAPHADVYGSLFVRELTVAQSLLVHYDPQVTTKQEVRCGL